MRVLLVQPKLPQHVQSLGKLEPLPLEILATSIPSHQVRIFDYRFEDSLTEAIRSWRPDVVGVTAVTVEYAAAVSAIMEVRAVSDKIRIVVGGCHATMVPDDFNLPSIDAIVIGLGHQTFGELLSAYENGGNVSSIPGLALPANGILSYTPEREIERSFESIPSPNRSLTFKYRRLYGATSSFGSAACATSITSLGCPGRCIFCSSWKQNNGKYLERDAESAVEDILSVPEQRLLLADDNSLHNIERAWKMVDLMSRAKTKKRIRAYARADTIAANPDLMKALKEVGFHWLIVGYEAVTDRQLKKYNKGTSVEINRTAMRVLREAGIQSRAMFVISPDFVGEDFERMRAYLDEEGVRTPLFMVLTPLPGTNLYERVRSTLLTRDHAFLDFVHCVLPTKLDYMEFFDQYAETFLYAYSLKRYAKAWLKEFRQFLAEGSWPVSELRKHSLATAVFLRIIFHAIFRKLRKDYELIAATCSASTANHASDTATCAAIHDTGAKT